MMNNRRKGVITALSPFVVWAGILIAVSPMEIPLIEAAKISGGFILAVVGCIAAILGLAEYL